MPNVAAIGQTITEISQRSFDFQDDGRSLSLNCKKFRILTADKVETVKMSHHSSCQISWQSVKPLLSREMAISQFIQHGGCLPSWICCAHLDHARRVFDGLHCCAKLVGISAILSIICTFLDFASLA